MIIWIYCHGQRTIARPWKGHWYCALCGMEIKVSHG